MINLRFFSFINIGISSYKFPCESCFCCTAVSFWYVVFLFPFISWCFLIFLMIPSLVRSMLLNFHIVNFSVFLLLLKEQNSSLNQLFFYAISLFYFILTHFVVWHLSWRMFCIHLKKNVCSALLWGDCSGLLTLQDLYFLSGLLFDCSFH